MLVVTLKCVLEWNFRTFFAALFSYNRLKFASGSTYRNLCLCQPGWWVEVHLPTQLVSGNALLSPFEDETIYLFLEGKAFCLLAERKIQNSLLSSH